MGAMSGWNRTTESTNGLLESTPLQQGCAGRDPPSRHSASEVATDCAWNYGVFGSEHAPHRDATGHVGVGHARHELDDVGLARETLKLADRLCSGRAGP
jgi:hypothetical protein